MTVRAFALVLTLGLPMATGAYAAVVAAHPSTASDQTSNAQTSKNETASPPLPVTWVPSWLMEPLSRAIADATDTRPRK